MLISIELQRPTRESPWSGPARVCEWGDGLQPALGVECRRTDTILTATLTPTL